MCRGGGVDLLYLLCLISNILPQLEQSSLHPTTVLRHRLLLQTTCYNHLRLLLHLLISSKGKQKQQQARNPLRWGGGGGEKPEGPSAVQTTTEIKLIKESRLRCTTPNMGAVLHTGQNGGFIKVQNGLFVMHVLRQTGHKISDLTWV